MMRLGPSKANVIGTRPVVGDNSALASSFVTWDALLRHIEVRDSTIEDDQ
jgi:hypothetical protein